MIAAILLGMWLNWGQGAVPAQYFKDARNVVHIQGLVQTPVFDDQMNNAIFILPPGYRPSGYLYFAVPNNGGTFGQVAISVNGEVLAASGSAGWWSLSGISFVATH